ncbi:unnamed protein product [Larinioides sclopetarius]|uniref:Uncharacterized protein n=1 Tax=Larinioides sclopetarius TaxID=280406 RepID=A0AAV1Z183_9ARAC
MLKVISKLCLPKLEHFIKRKALLSTYYVLETFLVQILMNGRMLKLAKQQYL